MNRTGKACLAGFVALGVGVALAGVGPSAAASTGDTPSRSAQVASLESYWEGQATPTADPTAAATQASVLTSTLLAKGQPDECFAGIGKPYPQGTRDAKGHLVCPEGSQPKVNQAYVWGLAKAGDHLWFGTGPNIHCLVQSTYLQSTAAGQTDSWVCEGEQSTYRTSWAPGGTVLPAALGDFRPPGLFMYDQSAKKLVDKVARLDAMGRARLHSTLGIRSGGASANRVFLAGPSISGGLNVFVFGVDGSYIGSENLPGFSNIRKWVTVQGQLYTGVRAGTGGKILRYLGSSVADPFQYEVVGTFTSEPAEFAEHQGRLFVSTWPAAGLASVWMSPLVGRDKKLTSADDIAWRSVWNAAQYEPDLVTAATYGGGALASFNGKLVWGTMHVPMTAALAHAARYGPSADATGQIATLLGTHRAISIFSLELRPGGLKPRVTLLYGSATLPAYDGTAWTMQPNRMGGVEPLYGPSGFGNTFNNYTWTMSTYRGSLYVGTMDWSYLLSEGLASALPELALPEGTQLSLVGNEFGADLWRFGPTGGPAVAESVDGVGNYANYGIRTMVSDDALYLGTANPMNLMTNLSDDKPEGGWELLRLRPVQ